MLPRSIGERVLHRTPEEGDWRFAPDREYECAHLGIKDDCEGLKDGAAPLLERRPLERMGEERHDVAEFCELLRGEMQWYRLVVCRARARCGDGQRKLRRLDRPD